MFLASTIFTARRQRFHVPWGSMLSLPAVRSLISSLQRRWYAEASWRASSTRCLASIFFNPKVAACQSYCKILFWACRNHVTYTRKYHSSRCSIVHTLHKNWNQKAAYTQGGSARKEVGTRARSWKASSAVSRDHFLSTNSNSYLPRTGLTILLVEITRWQSLRNGVRIFWYSIR